MKRKNKLQSLKKTKKSIKQESIAKEVHDTLSTLIQSLPERKLPANEELKQKQPNDYPQGEFPERVWKLEWKQEFLPFKRAK